MQNKKKLLPLGFYELTGDEAKKNYEYTKNTLESFMNGDYQLIKTSLIEFVENYDKKNLENTFNFSDNIYKYIGKEPSGNSVDAPIFD
jgi:ATP phosphoribosyltransferase regulatory subunit HisZ